MRLARVTACLLAAGCVAAAAPAAHAGARAQARLTACTTSDDAAGRRATFEGDMRGVPGATRMQMRFRLRARGEGERRWDKVAAPGFGIWTSADAGVARYVYTKTVERLAQGLRYRAVVAFRWLGPDGRVLARARRRTPACAQPDPRPDLRPLGLEAFPGTREGTLVYEVRVRNDGGSDAGPFSVLLDQRAGRSALGGRAGLAPGSVATIRAQAPACRAGETVTVRVAHGASAPADGDAGNDVLALPCPGGGRA